MPTNGEAHKSKACSICFVMRSDFIPQIIGTRYREPEVVTAEYSFRLLPGVTRPIVC